LAKKGMDAWRAKSWYTVVAPDYFGGVEIGETPADSPEKLLGRVIEVTLRELTNDITKQHVKLKFQIDRVNGERAYSKFIGHSFTRDYVRSKVRRGTTRIDAIFDVKTADGKKIRVCAIAFTRYRAKTSQEDEMRSIMREYITEEASKTKFEDFVRKVVGGEYNKEMEERVRKIFPVRAVEIRKTKVLK